MKKALFIQAIVLLVLVSCATLRLGTTPEQQVMTYEQMGVFLNTVKPNLQANCDAGVYSAATCAQLKETYNKAVDSYKAAGTAQISQLTAKTPQEQAQAQTDYAKAKAELTKLLMDLQKYFK